MRAETVEEILQMMGLRVAKKALQDIIEEVDEDGEEQNESDFAIVSSYNPLSSSLQHTVTFA